MGFAVYEVGKAAFNTDSYAWATILRFLKYTPFLIRFRFELACTCTQKNRQRIDDSRANPPRRGLCPFLCRIRPPHRMYGRFAAERPVEASEWPKGKRCPLDAGRSLLRPPPAVHLRLSHRSPPTPTPPSTPSTSPLSYTVLMVGQTRAIVFS